MKESRKLTVYETTVSRNDNRSYLNRQCYKSIPQIRMQGVWLEKLGFKQGTKFEVLCENGKLTLTALQ